MSLRHLVLGRCAGRCVSTGSVVAACALAACGNVREQGLGDDRYGDSFFSDDGSQGDASCNDGAVAGDLDCFGSHCGNDGGQAAGDREPGGDLRESDEDLGDAAWPSGDHTLGDSTAGDTPSGGDHEQGGDATPSGDVDITIGPHAYFIAHATATPDAIASPASFCLDAACSFVLVGRAYAPWAVYLADRLGVELTLADSSSGDLQPEYLGGGQYSSYGTAELWCDELPLSTSLVELYADGATWVLTNGCPRPLIELWLFPDGLDAASEQLETGATVCPAASPWAHAARLPPDAVYDVTVYDFDTSAIYDFTEYDLPQDSGWVVLPAPPSEGRLELAWLDSRTDLVRELEHAALNYHCP